MTTTPESEMTTHDLPEGQESSTRSNKQHVYPWIKRCLDILISLIAMIVLLIPMLLIALLILIVDGRPVLYRQTRLGKGGRRISIIKFRSMCPDADDRLNHLPPHLQAQYRREYKIDHDPRVTRLGSFLRRTSLDELPQLWNILRGDLSIVGPRPILPDEIRFYSPQDRERFLSVTPGLTGYWQACASLEDTYSSGRRQKMELYYAARVSFTFDLRIIFKTFATVFRKSLNSNHHY